MVGRGESPMRQGNGRNRRRAYTLVEVLIVVTVLGIAGAMVVPAFSQTGVLRVQSAVRLVVSDITEAQSDALAYQGGRGIVFDSANRSYRVAEVRGTTLDTTLDLIVARSLATDGGFGDSRISTVNFGGTSTLVFDEMGSPETAPGSGLAAPDGYLDITGSGQTYRILVEAYTGRVTVQSINVVSPE